MPTVLAIDTTSSNLTVALASEGEVLAADRAPQRSASRRLLPMIEGLLTTAALDLSTLDGIVALRGPGSFTGIRIGLATAQGLQQATGLPAVAWSTLEVLAMASSFATPVLCLVHALREDWYSQRFDGLSPLEEPRRRSVEDLTSIEFAVAVRVPSERASALPFPATAIESLASVAAEHASRRPPTWDARTLSRPLYLAPAPASLPRHPKPVLPAT